MSHSNYERKIAKRNLFYRLWMFMIHDIFLTKYHYTETRLEHYERNARNGNAAYVAAPPMLYIDDANEVML